MALAFEIGKTFGPDRKGWVLVPVLALKSAQVRVGGHIRQLVKSSRLLVPLTSGARDEDHRLVPVVVNAQQLRVDPRLENWKQD